MTVAFGRAPPREDPGRISEQADLISTITTEQIRVENEIARELEGYEIDKEALSAKLFQRLSLEYQRISDDPYTVHMMKKAFSNCFLT